MQGKRTRANQSTTSGGKPSSASSASPASSRLLNLEAVDIESQFVLSNASSNSASLRSSSSTNSSSSATSNIALRQAAAQQSAALTTMRQPNLKSALAASNSAHVDSTTSSSTSSCSTSLASSSFAQNSPQTSNVINSTVSRRCSLATHQQQLQHQQQQQTIDILTQLETLNEDCKNETSRKLRLQLYVFVIRCISHPYNARAPSADELTSSSFVRQQQPKLTLTILNAMIANHCKYVNSLLLAASSSTSGRQASSSSSVSLQATRGKFPHAHLQKLIPNQQLSFKLLDELYLIAQCSFNRKFFALTQHSTTTTTTAANATNATNTATFELANNETINLLLKSIASSDLLRLLVLTNAACVSDARDLFRAFADKLLSVYETPHWSPLTKLFAVEPTSRAIILQSWTLKFEQIVAVDSQLLHQQQQHGNNSHHHHQALTTAPNTQQSISSNSAILSSSVNNFSKDAQYSMFQNVLNIKKFEHQLLFNSLQLDSNDEQAAAVRRELDNRIAFLAELERNKKLLMPKFVHKEMESLYLDEARACVQQLMINLDKLPVINKHHNYNHHQHHHQHHHHYHHQQSAIIAASGNSRNKAINQQRKRKGRKKAKKRQQKATTRNLNSAQIANSSRANENDNQLCNRTRSANAISTPTPTKIQIELKSSTTTKLATTTTTTLTPTTKTSCNLRAVDVNLRQIERLKSRRPVAHFVLSSAQLPLWKVATRSLSSVCEIVASASAATNDLSLLTHDANDSNVVDSGNVVVNALTTTSDKIDVSLCFNLQVIIMEARGLKQLLPTRELYCTMEVEGSDKLQTERVPASKPLWDSQGDFVTFHPLPVLKIKLFAVNASVLSLDDKELGRLVLRPKISSVKSADWYSLISQQLVSATCESNELRLKLAVKMDRPQTLKHAGFLLGIGKSTWRKFKRRYHCLIQVSNYTFFLVSYKDKKAKPSEVLNLYGFTVDFIEPPTDLIMQHCTDLSNNDFNSTTSTIYELPAFGLAGRLASALRNSSRSSASDHSSHSTSNEFQSFPLSSSSLLTGSAASSSSATATGASSTSATSSLLSTPLTSSSMTKDDDNSTPAASAIRTAAALSDELHNKHYFNVVREGDSVVFAAESEQDALAWVMALYRATGQAHKPTPLSQPSASAVRLQNSSLKSTFAACSHTADSDASPLTLTANTHSFNNNSNNNNSNNNSFSADSPTSSLVSSVNQANNNNTNNFILDEDQLLQAVMLPSVSSTASNLSNVSTAAATAAAAAALNSAEQRARKHGMDEFLSADASKFNHNYLFRYLQHETLKHRLDDNQCSLGWLSPSQLFVLDEYCARYGVRTCYRHLTYLNSLLELNEKRNFFIDHTLLNYGFDFCASYVSGNASASLHPMGSANLDLRYQQSPFDNQHQYNSSNSNNNNNYNTSGADNLTLAATRVNTVTIEERDLFNSIKLKLLKLIERQLASYCHTFPLSKPDGALKAALSLLERLLIKDQRASFDQSSLTGNNSVRALVKKCLDEAALANYKRVSECCNLATPPATVNRLVASTSNELNATTLASFNAASQARGGNKSRTTNRFNNNNNSNTINVDDSDFNLTHINETTLDSTSDADSVNSSLATSLSQLTTINNQTNIKQHYNNNNNNTQQHSVQQQRIVTMAALTAPAHGTNLSASTKPREKLKFLIRLAEICCEFVEETCEQFNDAFAWHSDLLLEHFELFWSLFTVDMDKILEELTTLEASIQQKLTKTSSSSLTLQLQQSSIHLLGDTSLLSSISSTKSNSSTSSTTAAVATTGFGVTSTTSLSSSSSSSNASSTSLLLAAQSASPFDVALTLSKQILELFYILNNHLRRNNKLLHCYKFQCYLCETFKPRLLRHLDICELNCRQLASFAFEKETQVNYTACEQMFAKADELQKLLTIDLHWPDEQLAEQLQQRAKLIGYELCELSVSKALLSFSAIERKANKWSAANATSSLITNSLFSNTLSICAEFAQLINFALETRNKSLRLCTFNCADIMSYHSKIDKLVEDTVNEIQTKLLSKLLFALESGVLAKLARHDVGSLLAPILSLTYRQGMSSSGQDIGKQYATFVSNCIDVLHANITIDDLFTLNLLEQWHNQQLTAINNWLNKRFDNCLHAVQLSALTAIVNKLHSDMSLQGLSDDKLSTKTHKQILSRLAVEESSSTNSSTQQQQQQQQQQTDLSVNDSSTTASTNTIGFNTQTGKSFATSLLASFSNSNSASNAQQSSYQQQQQTSSSSSPLQALTPSPPPPSQQQQINNSQLASSSDDNAMQKASKMFKGFWTSGNS